MEKLGGSNGFSAKLIGRNIGFRGARLADLRQRGLWETDGAFVLPPRLWERFGFKVIV